MRFVFLVALVVAAAAAGTVPSSAAGNSYLRVLAVFQSLQQGQSPMSAVAVGADGTLYGTASLGGAKDCSIAQYGCGLVFAARKSGTTWTIVPIYDFHGPDGAAPDAGVILDRSGSIYGTTTRGGTGGCSGGCGTVYELTPHGTTYAERTLYSFKGGADGYGPTGKLIADPSGALYGLTVAGGTGTGCTNGQQNGCGTAYKLTPAGGSYAESVIYDFQGGAGDGAIPQDTALVLDRRGDLFGTTTEGGDQACSDGCGTAYELVPGNGGYAERVLHFFSGPPDGARPYGGVIWNADGALYGTTEIGGDLNACPAFGGCGTVFRLGRSGSTFRESVVYAFVAGKDAYAPLQGLAADDAGNLYGASPGGGYDQIGVLFKLTRGAGGFTETILHDFHAGQDGYGPYGSLIVNERGTALCGTAIGGPYGGYGGEIFEMKM